MSNSELKEIYPKKNGLQQKRLLSCSMCPYQTNRSENLKKHRVSIHERGTFHLQCCGNRFANKTALRHHSVAFHSHGYVCNICGHVFNRRANLRGHHDAVHLGIKEFTCQLCDYATSCKSNLERHGKIHGSSTSSSMLSSSTPGDVQSRAGSSQFPQETISRDSHPDTSRNHNPILATLLSQPANADVQFSRRVSASAVMSNSELLEMQPEKNVVQQEKQLSCSLCPYRTNKGINLKRHMATMHEQSTADLECCGNRFANKTAFRHHTAAFHSHGYACTICGYVFRHLALLRRHRVVHSGFKEFKCQLCDFETAQLCNLDRHMKKMHDSSTSSQSSLLDDEQSCAGSSDSSDSSGSQSPQETTSGDPHPGTSRDHSPIQSSLLSQPANAEDQVIQRHVVDPVEDHGPLQKQPAPLPSSHYPHLAQEGMMNWGIDSAMHSFMNNPILSNLSQRDNAADQVNQNDSRYNSCWGNDVDLLEDPMQKQPNEILLNSNLEHHMKMYGTSTSSPMLSSSSIGDGQSCAGSSNGSGSQFPLEFSTISGDSYPGDDDAILASLSQPDNAEDPVDQWVNESVYDSYWGNDVGHLDEFCKHF